MTKPEQNVFLYRHDGVSAGGKLLARTLGIRIIRTEGSKFSGGAGKTVINWGTSNFPYPTRGAHIENNPEAVGNATNKRRFFELCREKGGIELPTFTTSRTQARVLLKDHGLLFARTKLQGSGGDGIVECQTEDAITALPEGTLFVEYVKKKQEYRVHVADGKVLDVQEKRKRSSTPLEQTNFRIRNLANGFVFCREDVSPPKQVLDNAIAALAATGLDFGAVDVVYNIRHKRAAVLEVNTAPGVEGTTALNYATHFAKKFGIDPSELRNRFDMYSHMGEDD